MDTESALLHTPTSARAYFKQGCVVTLPLAKFAPVSCSVLFTDPSVCCTRFHTCREAYRAMKDTRKAQRAFVRAESLGESHSDLAQWLTECRDVLGTTAEAGDMAGLGLLPAISVFPATNAKPRRPTLPSCVN